MALQELLDIVKAALQERPDLLLDLLPFIASAIENLPPTEQGQAPTEEQDAMDLAGDAEEQGDDVVPRPAQG